MKWPAKREREAPDLFEEDFIEIYREKPNVMFRYQKGSFWSIKCKVYRKKK